MAATPVVTDPLDPMDPSDVLTTFESHTVEYTTTPTIPGSWVVVPWLYCRQLKLAVNAYDQANLEYLIGLGLHQPGDTAAHDWVPLDIRGKYVRITIPQTAPLVNIVWVGYVLQENLQRDGVHDDGGGNKFQGEGQLLTAMGLEWFLDRSQVQASLIYKSGTAGILIKRALKFNGGESQSIDMKAAHRGNRSEQKNIDDLYVFSDDNTTTDEFTAEDIAEYLLKYVTPSNSDGQAAPCRFALDGTGHQYLTGFHPTVTTERRTVFQIFNEIFSPQRGLIWYLYFDVTGDISLGGVPTAFVLVRSLATDDIALTGGNIFKANQQQITLDFDTEVDVKIVDLKDIGYRDYHRVICRGARQTVTMTVGMEDGTLIEDWKDDAVNAYLDGAKADADYHDTSMTPGKQADRNDALRRGDLLSRVYSYFRIPKTWNGQTGDGGTGEPDYAFAVLSDAGEVTGGLALTAAGIRLLNKTRLKLGVDYKNPKSPVSHAPDGSLEEFLSPFAILKVETAPGINSNPLPERWQLCEKMEHAQFHAGTRVSGHIHTSYHLKMQEHVPGIVIRAAGAPQHTVALNHFLYDAVGGGNAEPSKVKPELDYETLRATVCAESDNYAEGIVEVTPLPTGVPIENLIVDLGDDFRLDFLAKNTIVDLKSGDPVLASTSALLRDDRPALRDIANIAFQWYRANRNSLTVEFRQLRNLFGLGQMITTIGAGSTISDVNTVISTLTFDLKTGTTTVHTHDQTLDVRSLYEPRRKQSKA